MGEDREVIVKRLRNMDNELNIIRGKFGQYLNIGEEDFMPEAYEPNNELKNISTVKRILELCAENNVPDWQAKSMLREWAPDISDEELMQLAQKARSQSQ